MKTNYNVFFQKMMNNKEVKIEYEKLTPQYNIIKEVISLRREKSLTQEDLAKLTGISKTRIKNIENGNIIPTIEMLNKIAQAGGKQLIVNFK